MAAAAAVLVPAPEVRKHGNSICLCFMLLIPADFSILSVARKVLVDLPLIAALVFPSFLGSVYKTMVWFGLVVNYSFA